MRQSRVGSLIESSINVLLGFITGVITQAIFFPLFGINIPILQNMYLAAIFTLISLLRGYVVRRIFNNLRIFTGIDGK